MKAKIPPPVIAAVIAGAMWLAARHAPFGHIDLPGQRAVGFTLMGAGVLIDLTSIAHFFRKKTTVNPVNPEGASALVVSGLYRLSRNPMYFGLLLVLSGWALLLGFALNIVLLWLFVILITELQIKPEEDVLRAKFGADYDAYCGRVRRWI